MATNVVEWLSLAQTVKRISGRDSWRKTHQPHIMHALKAVSGYATLDVSLASTSIRRIAGCEVRCWQPAVKRQKCQKKIGVSSFFPLRKK
jgi:hypothetical protein